MIGQIVGNHRITEEIRSGGMGAVYRAEHVMLGRPAAVKVLLPQFSHAKEIVQRFFTEAKAASSIRHPNIVEIYDFGHLSDEQAYIVMELVPGDTLARRLVERLMGEAELLELARQVGSALAAAHDRGVIHRDLKPDNVMLAPDPEAACGWRCKLVDFGIAKLADAQGGSTQTRTGVLLGTPTYMSPEQCRGAGKVGHRSDLYSLGCILYEAASGNPPFADEGAGEVIAAHLGRLPTPLREMADVSHGFAQLVERLLEKRPDDRPATAAAMLDEIEAVASGASTSTPAQPPIPSGHRTTLSGAAAQAVPSPEAPRRPAWVVGAWVAAVGAAIAATIVLSGVAKRSSGGAPADPSGAIAPAAIDAATLDPARAIERAPVTTGRTVEPVGTVEPERAIEPGRTVEPARPADAAGGSGAQPGTDAARAADRPGAVAPAEPSRSRAERASSRGPRAGVPERPPVDPAATTPATPPTPTPTPRPTGPVVDPDDL